MKATLLLAADRPAKPWKNGAGVMWDIAIYPNDADTADFAWRFSVAEIALSRPFSLFPGVTRHFAVLDGAGVDLAFGNGTRVRMAPAASALCFSGDEAIDATLIDGPVFALNLMLRAPELEGRLTRGVPMAAEHNRPHTRILIAGATGASLALADETITLARFDALVLPPDRHVSLDSGMVWCAEISAPAFTPRSA